MNVNNPQGDLVKPFLSVVVPAYNEERRLARTLLDITSYVDSKGYSAEIVVVDDGSEDGTAKLAEEISAANPIVRLVRNEHRGKAFTVRTGMLSATGQYVLFTDADGATPITELDKFLPYLQGEFDLAVGSREGLGAARHAEPPHRHLMGRVFNLIVRIVALPGINDTQCGFKAFKHHAAQDLFGHMQLYDSHSVTIRGAMLTGFDVEILFLARKWGYRIIEVPVNWYYGTHSKVNPLRDSWRNLRDVLRVRWNDLRGRYRRS